MDFYGFLDFQMSRFAEGAWEKKIKQHQNDGLKVNLPW